MPLQFINKLKINRVKSEKSVVDSESSEFINLYLDIDNLVIQNPPELEPFNIKVTDSSLKPKKLELTKYSKFLQSKPEQGKLIPNIIVPDLDLTRKTILKYLGLQYITAKKSIGKKQYIFRKGSIKVVLTYEEIKSLLYKSGFSYFA